MATPVRLQRYLATAGVAARRKAEELITAGRVKVNGVVVTVLGTKVDPENDDVTVDGEAVAALDQFYVLFNKPKGCITAVTDDRGRPTVMDYLPNLPVPVKPVGRLDFYTEGVLLLTNDGDLASRLLAPTSHIAKTYHVKVHGRLERDDIAALRDGITLDDGTTTLPAEIEILPGESKHTWLGITLHEGKHRQIHRMLEALGYQVDKLQRVAFANLTFHDLRVGDARELTQQELNQLRDLVDLDHSPVARGRWRAKREATDIPRRARAKVRAEAEEAAFIADADTGDDRDDWQDARDRSAVGAERDAPRPRDSAESVGPGTAERGGPRPRGRDAGERGPAYGARPGGEGGAGTAERGGPRTRGRDAGERGPAYGARPGREGGAGTAERGGPRPRGRDAGERGPAYGARPGRKFGDGGAGTAERGGPRPRGRDAGERGAAYGARPGRKFGEGGAGDGDRDPRRARSSSSGGDRQPSDTGGAPKRGFGPRVPRRKPKS